MIVKVCGMREADNIRAVEQLGIDWMGFIFWPGSSRYVAQPPASMPTRCRRVGVFVDAPLDEVRQKVQDYALDFVQLHGSESVEYVAQLRPTPLIKAFNIASTDDLAQVTAYEGVVDYFLFDTKGHAVGGNGAKFDWSVLSAYDGATPFLLSGGIGPDDAGRVRQFRHPRFAGIDLNSRFEVAPAQKAPQLLKHFLDSLDSLDSLDNLENLENLGNLGNLGNLVNLAHLVK